MLFKEIIPGQLALAYLQEIAQGQQGLKLSLSPSAYAAIDASAQCVARVVAEKRVVYGINTGFGLLANTHIPEKDLELLQRSLVLSHAAGIGQPLKPATVRLVLALKINSLARGYSGVRREIVDTLLALLNHDILPVIPEKGSVGASGDLAPLAHMSLVLMGEGEAMIGGQRVSGAEALARAGCRPIVLGPKEGLALLNGTQVSTALALEGLFAAQTLYVAAAVAGSLSVEAALGSRTPFDDRIHAVRGQQTQRDAATLYRLLLDESEIGRSHNHCSKVQDPYSLRCQPQVMGACLGQIRFVSKILQSEANGVSDNPLVFSEGNEILSGGNFHAEPIALAADNLALALAEIGALSERRMALLEDSHLSSLTPFLVPNSGVNSGFMMAHVTASALASENKSLAHPASVDSLPTSANQEDHVSMATFAARRLQSMVENTAGIVAIELLAACQGVDLRSPLKTSPLLEEAKSELRALVPFYERDRYFAPDIEKAMGLVLSGTYNRWVAEGFFSEWAES